MLYATETKTGFTAIVQHCIRSPLLLCGNGNSLTTCAAAHYPSDVPNGNAEFVAAVLTLHNALFDTIQYTILCTKFGL
jgi:hypothetical protein